MKLLLVIASTLYLLMAPNGIGHSQDMSLVFAKNFTAPVASGIEIASITSADKPISRDKKVRPSSLNLVCAASGSLHLVLVTRLPFGRSSEQDLRPGTRDGATLFFDGIERKIEVDFSLTSIGKSANTLANILGFTEAGEPDTAFSDPLRPAQLDALQEWFEERPPKRVDVMGFLETGVFMHGRVTGQVIRAFSLSCPS